MKKSLLLAGLLSASTMMAETQFFVGAGFDRADADTSVSGSGITVNDSVKENGYKLKFGTITDDTHVVSVSYGDYDELDISLANYSYLIPLPYDKTKLIVGAHAGISNFEESDGNISIKDNAFS